MDGEGWDGVAYDGSLPRGRSDCRLALRGRRLEARLPSGDTLRIDLGRIEVTRPDGVVFSFASTVPGGPTFTTHDERAHAAVMAALPARTAAAVAHEPRRLGPGQKVVAAALALVLAVAVLALLLMGPLAGLVVRAVPLSVDEEIGRKALEQVFHDGPFGKVRVRDEPEVRAVIDAVMQRLTPDLPAGSFDVRVVELPFVNAFALPGGHLVVTSALLQVVESPEELAGVLAHEISHVTRRHTVQLLVRHVGLRVTMMGVLGRVDSVGTALVAAAASVASLGFNRGMEADADDQGVRRLALTAIDPQGAVRFMERLAAREREMRANAGKLLDAPDDGTAPREFLRTHPLTPRRMEAMRARIARLAPTTPVPIDADLGAMKRALAPVSPPAP